jgi:cobalt-zinc-cadmium resistance protein CzcA
MHYNEDFSVSGEIEIIVPEDTDIESNPWIQLLKMQNNYSEAILRIEKNKMLPDFSLNYFIGNNNYADARSYQGFQVGMAIPLFFGSQKARIESGKISLNAQQLMTENQIIALKNKNAGYKRDELKYREAIEFFNNSGKSLYDEIIRAALKSYQSGEIDLFKFTNSYENALQIKLDYLDNVFRYNSIIVEQKYLEN